MVNSKVLTKLPQAIIGQGQYAMLARLDGVAVFEFITMPIELPWERALNYTASGAAGVIVPRQQFGSVEGWTLQISVPMSGRHEKKSLLSYVDSLAKLQIPDEDAVAPPILAFRWGTRSFSPCIMTRFSKTEKGWYPNGDLAECTVGFSLLEVPVSQVVG
ncbi:MAG: hypothetical protein KME30_24965 [Iphinoe sp. HA4291-MV1]|jgi:hypothetical protein|nr:hypothetical protein [Iphinoe sp. HA4291-MV1]